MFVSDRTASCIGYKLKSAMNAYSVRDNKSAESSINQTNVIFKFIPLINFNSMLMIYRFCVKIQANEVMCQTFGEDKPGYMQRNFKNTKVLDCRNLCSDSDVLAVVSLLELSSSD